MGSLVSGLFGGGNKQAEEARKAQKVQQIANERQLAQVQADENRAKPSRAAPRGRRLFEDQSLTNLKDTLG